MKIYISGQITGLDFDEAQGLFAIAEASLKGLGFDPVNPMEGETADSPLTWKEHMIADMAALFDCNGIYMLHGWADSKGARIEHAIATELDIPIIYQPMQIGAQAQ